MTCKICGTELLNDAKFCTNCGAKVEEISAEVVTADSAASAAPVVNETVSESTSEMVNSEVNTSTSQAETSQQTVYTERVDGQIVDEGRHFDSANQSYSQNVNQSATQGYGAGSQTASSAGPAPSAPTGPKGFAIASLICGIVSLLCCCCSPIAIITAGVAVGLGIYVITTGLPGKEMAIAGIICGGIGLFIFLISMIFSVSGAFKGITDSLDITDLIESL